jgi:alpha-beta hydrolase superfamily lysophospholipase
MSYSIQPLELTPDYEGRVVATILSKSASQPSKRAVLYVHGFVDYFFQDHMADRFTRSGYSFYALELRKYGRSLLPHQHPNYCRDVREYFEEIDRAVEKIAEDGNTKLLLMGHSTGGLITSLYASMGKHADRVSALLLNSPFLEFNVGRCTRLATLVVSAICKPLPYANICGVLSPLYAQSVHSSHKGEWDFNLAWKPIEGFPSYYRWILAIRNGHKAVKRGLNIKCPILLMHSARSFVPKTWSDDIQRADVVLNIEHMKRYGKRLGRNITFHEVPDGMHDLTLSRKDVREGVLDTMVAWADEVMG